jgi:hypothetical protein
MCVHSLTGLHGVLVDQQAQGQLYLYVLLYRDSFRIVNVRFHLNGPSIDTV